jgi:hypothetical protein
MPLDFLLDFLASWSNAFRLSDSWCAEGACLQPEWPPLCSWLRSQPMLTCVQFVSASSSCPYLVETPFYGNPCLHAARHSCSNAQGVCAFLSASPPCPYLVETPFYGNPCLHAAKTLLLIFAGSACLHSDWHLICDLHFVDPLPWGHLLQRSELHPRGRGPLLVL